MRHDFLVEMVPYKYDWTVIITIIIAKFVWFFLHLLFQIQPIQSIVPQFRPSPATRRNIEQVSSELVYTWT